VERIKDESVLERFKRYPIWISAMESHDLQLEKPGAKGRWAGKWNWTLWQFTVMGDLSTAGIPNPRNPSAERLDVNIFPGTLAQFQKVMGIPVPIEVAQKVETQIPIVKPNVVTPGDSSAPLVPRKDPPKDIQVADVTPSDSSATKPGDSSAASNPSTGTVVPTETPKDPPKETQVAAVTPSDTSANKPTESSAANNPGGSTVAPAETPKDPPKETQVVVVAPSDSSANKPNDSSTVNNPGGSTTSPAETSKDQPKETQVAAVTPSDSSANKPGESGAANNPGGGTVTPITPIEPPKQNQVVAIPSPDSVSNKPEEAGRIGGESKIRPSPASAHSPKTMIEIVLLNGRIIRVDASIDPAVLSRFIALLEAP
jgi:hypothetical protein